MTRRSRKTAEQTVPSRCQADQLLTPFPPDLGGPVPWLTWDEYQSLDERGRDYEFQRAAQAVFGYMGFWKTCKLGLCRRRHACLGFLSDVQYAESRRTTHPPCYSEDRYDELMAFRRELRRHCEGEPGPFSYDFDNKPFTLGPPWERSRVAEIIRNRTVVTTKGLDTSCAKPKPRDRSLRSGVKT